MNTKSGTECERCPRCRAERAGLAGRPLTNAEFIQINDLIVPEEPPVPEIVREAEAVRANARAEWERTDHIWREAVLARDRLNRKHAHSEDREAESRLYEEKAEADRDLVAAAHLRDEAAAAVVAANVELNRACSIAAQAATAERAALRAAEQDAVEAQGHEERKSRVSRLRKRLQTSTPADAPADPEWGPRV